MELLTIGLVLYFLPTFTAMLRHHANTRAIFALNLFTGWTIIGWIAAFVWAETHQQRPLHAAPPALVRRSRIF